MILTRRLSASSRREDTNDLNTAESSLEAKAGAAVVSSLDTPSVLTALGSSLQGLAGTEAAARRAIDGPNSLPPARGRSVARELADQLTNMFAIVLIVSAVLTFLTYLLTSPRNAANLELTFGILGVVALNALIGFAQEHAAEQTAEALQAMVPHTAKVLRDSQLIEIKAVDLVHGDMVVLEAGDAVSADCRVIEAHGLSIELAALTGESQPVGRTSEPVAAGAVVVEARNCVFMGTSVTEGAGRAVVFATGLRTEFGKIYRLTAGVPAEQSPLQRQIDGMARRIAVIAIAAGAVLFCARVLTGNAAAASFVFALAVMVALVPEGLPATMSVSLGIAVRRMAEKHALLKRLAAVEALGSTTVICTDKTGTLTEAEMTLQQIYASGQFHPVTGVGYAPEGEVEESTRVVDLLRVGALCSDARLLPPTAEEGWRVLGDTTEGAILVAASKAGIDPEVEATRTPRVGAFPFDSDRKLMTTLHQVGDHVQAYVKGAPQAVLALCTDVMWNGQEIPLDAIIRRQVEDANDSMANQALRVLAVASKPVDSDQVPEAEAESGLTFLGLVGMIDPPRPEVSAAVTACERAGIRIFMVTGDYGLTAKAVARRVGITGDGSVRVVTGSDLDALNDDALKDMLEGDGSVVFARVRPEHKLRVVTTLEQLGEIVAVTGDGANDAPALKRASVGVAMGEGGTDVARAAAVMVLLDDSFASIAAAVELGRAVYQNLRHVLVYIFSHNMAELAPILVATFVRFPLVPINALQVLSIDLGSDVLPGLALGAERPEPGIMDRPPRPPSEHLMSWSVVRRFLFLGSIQSIGVVFAFFWRIHSAHLPFDQFTASNPTYREALTMTQVGIIVSQFFNRFTVRSDHESIFRIGIMSNRPLFFVGFIDVSLAVAVSYVPFLQSFFHTAPLRVSDWLILIAFGVLLLVADELRKAWHRRTQRRDRVTLPIMDESG